MANDKPLEKTLVALDLAGGIDERTRPELPPGLATVTSIVNLVQDQTGAWVKRHGTAAAPLTDTSGMNTYPAVVRKIIPLVTGWCAIADDSRLLKKNDSGSSFAWKGRLMPFTSIEAFVAGSTGDCATYSRQDSLSFPRSNVISSASCTTHDAWVTVKSSTACILSVRERATGTIWSYSTDDIFQYTVSGMSGSACKIVFAANRYLHIYAGGGTAEGGAGTGVTGAYIDVLSAMPQVLDATLATVTDESSALCDVVAGSSAVYVLVSSVTVVDVGVACVVYSVSTSSISVTGNSGGALGLESGQRWRSMDICDALGNLWLLAPDTSAAKLMAVSASDVSTETQAAWDTTKPGTTFGVSPDGQIVLIGSNNAIAIGSGTVGGFVVHKNNTTPTVSAGAFDLHGTITGWNMVTHPFWMVGSSSISSGAPTGGPSGRFFSHVCEDMPSTATSDVACHAIIDLFELTSGSVGLTAPVACVIDPFLGVKQSDGAYDLGSELISSINGYRRASVLSSYDVTIQLQVLTASRTASVSFHKLRLHASTALSYANLGGSTHIAAGGINEHDGQSVVESGFMRGPPMDVAHASGTGALVGSYRYVAVYRYAGRNGASAFSRTSGPFAITNTAGSGTSQNLITVAAPSITQRYVRLGDVVAMEPFVELYRTLNGGTQYYLCATSQKNTALSQSAQSVGQMAVSGSYLEVTDNMSDATLAAQATFYRQPGTTNSPADRYPAPGTPIVIQHKDRLVCVDPYGQRIYYSSFFVDGETPWFNPTFSMFFHDGTGPITGLASMDGRLFVFKKDRIFTVDGDGPGEAGPVGNELSPPQALASRFGCVDHRSIVIGPNGIYYRSNRGFELLDRSLKVNYIGEKVQNLVATYPVTTSAVIDNISRVRWLIAASEGELATSGALGCEVVYDMTANAWSQSLYTGFQDVYGAAMQSCALVNDAGTEKLVYGDAYQGILVATDAAGTDRGSVYVPTKIESAWIRGGPQTRQRITDILLLAKKRSGNHAMKISLAYNYSDTYTQTHTWEPGDINGLAIEELAIQPSTQQVLAIRVKVEEIIPSDTGTYPVGDGKGCDFLGVSAEVVPKPGAPKLASGQKA